MKIRPLLLAAAMLLFTGCGANDSSSQQDIPKAEENKLTALEATKLMGNGINLGNTMEAYGHEMFINDTDADPTDYESLWGMPYTNQLVIDGMKASGFKATPHEDCAQIAQSAFSSDCTGFPKEYYRISRKKCVI